MAVAVAAALSVMFAFGVIAAMKAPEGIPGPEIFWPIKRPAVLAKVTVVLALVVAAFVILATAGALGALSKLNLAKSAAESGAGAPPDVRPCLMR